MQTWAKRIVVGLIVLAGLYVLLYLLPANLLLQNPGLFVRNPDRLKIDWGSAWSLRPGQIEVRKLRIDGRTRRIRWSIVADEGRGRVVLTALLGRKFIVRGFEGRGVEARVARDPDAAAGRPPAATKRRRSPWTIQLDGVRLAEIRALEYGPLRLDGKGRATGAFRLVLRTEAQVELQGLEMGGGRLLAKGRPMAENVKLRSAFQLGPYAPRRHPGIAGLDFLSGNLTLSGALADLPGLRRGAGPAPTSPGRLALDLRVEKGALLPGSRAEIAPPSGEGSRMVVLGSVVRAGTRARLRLEAHAKGFQLRRADGRPPFLESDVLHVTAAASEVRLSRLFAKARQVRSGGPTAALPGEVRGERLRLTFPGRRASLEISAAKGAGRIDLPALLRREVRLDGVKAEGAHLRLTPGLPPPQKKAASQRGRWSAQLADLQLEGDCEVALSDFRVDGKLRAAGGLSWGGGKLAIDGTSLDFLDGRLQAQGETVAHGLALQGKVGLAPLALAETKGRAILRLISGQAKVDGSLASLAFLKPYLAKASWLTLDGDGTLHADVLLDHGRLLRGSRFAVKPAHLRTEYLLSRATGSAEMTGVVERKKSGDELNVGVRFDRFEVRSREQPDSPPHVRGRGLRLSLVTRDLDLVRPGNDLRARIDLPTTEMKDLTFYNGYLPPASGVEIVSGSGSVGFWLEMETARSTARGEMRLASPGLVVRLNDVELVGALDLKAPLTSPDLRHGRFGLDGTRLALDRMALREIGADADSSETAPNDWWARLDLTRASMDFGRPLSVSGSVRLSMKDSGLLLALFSRRKRFLSWFKDLLTVEDVLAQGNLRLDRGAFVLNPLNVTGEKIELRTKLRLSRDRKRGFLYVRHGRKAVGIELLEGKRDFRLIRPLVWYQGTGDP